MKKVILALTILFSMAACHTKTVEETVVDNDTTEIVGDTLVLDSLMVDSAQICE
jgi:hypothetical protein